MLLRNTVKFAHMALSLVPKNLYAVDVISLVCKKLGMIDTEVFKVRYIQHVIFSPAIRIDNTVKHDFALNDGV
jgi:hypothetical protein